MVSLRARILSSACARGCFEGATIDLADGFIHLSTGEQVQETARLHFRDQPDLVVVAFEAGRLGPALRWEPSRGVNGSPTSTG